MNSPIPRSPIFEGLSDDAVSDIRPRITEVELEQGAVLFEKGDPGSELFTIVEGLLKVSVPDPHSGREKTLALLGDGEVIGEMASLGNQRRSGKATAIRDTRLLRISRETFETLLQSYPQIGLNMIKVLSRRLLSSDEELHNVTFKTIPGRLAAQLIQLAETYGESTPEGRRIAIELSHRQLADLVGTNRETVTRHLSRFREEGSIAVEDQRITILDQDLLEGWM